MIATRPNAAHREEHDGQARDHLLRPVKLSSRATSLAAEIKNARGIEARLIKGRGGQFEVVLDGRLIFSKKQLGRHANPGEILALIPA